MQEVSFTAKDKLVVPADLQASISKEVENDPHKVETRMKQVQFGKNTAGYDHYLAAVPKNKRQLRPEHPSTPDIYEKISKRQFDGRIKAWRRALHLWDNVDQRPDSKPRQKRKAESLENSETKDGTRSEEKQQAQESTSKRQRTETDSSKAIHSSFAEETVAETKDEIRPSWTIGEEDDDGYVSEDVL